MNEWVVYILECRDRTLYCGVTTDVRHRLRQHNKGRGAKYTRGRRPVRLVWQEGAAGKGEALRREAGIKRLTREQKLKLIGGV